MSNDESPDLTDERKAKRSGGGTRADRAEKRASERSVIPGPRSHGGTNRAATPDQQTDDHTRRRGPGPADDVQASDRDAPSLGGDDETRRD